MVDKNLIKIKLIIIPILLLSSFSFPAISSKSQINTPTLLIEYISSNPVPWTEVQHNVPESPISGNLLYKLSINLTFIFPKDTSFIGVFSFDCGISIFLENTSDWRILNFMHSCPMIAKRVVTSGIYNFPTQTYINSVHNYTNDNFPKIINLYAMTTMNKPQYKSGTFSYNLGDNQTNYNQTMPILNNQINIGSNELIFAFSTIMIFTSGVYSLIEYRKYSTLKHSNSNLPPFRNYLGNKITNTKKISHVELRAETLKKLEEIISENSK